MVRRMNKRGWMRIVEATIAVMIVIGFVLTYTAKIKKADEDLTHIVTPVLEEIAESNSLRANILSDNPDFTMLNDFVDARITNPKLDYMIKVCNLNDICGLDSMPNNVAGDVFAVERVISATPVQGDFKPKKIKIFLWRKS